MTDNTTPGASPASNSYDASSSASQDAQYGGSYTPAGQQTNDQYAAGQNSGHQSSGNQYAAGQYSGSQNAGTQYSGTQYSGNQYAGNQYAGAGPSKTLSIIGLVLGIASWVMGAGTTVLVPVAGIIVSVMAKKREPEGRTMANWGLWLSVASLVVGAIIWIVGAGAIIALINAGMGLATYGS